MTRLDYYLTDNSVYEDGVYEADAVERLVADSLDELDAALMGAFCEDNGLRDELVKLVASRLDGMTFDEAVRAIKGLTA